MQIQFKRSGGFSPLTNVSGGVKFDTQTAVVSVPNSDYHRTLEPEEEKELRDAARPDPDQLRSAPAPRHSDSFQYDITVTTEDGKTYELTSPSARLLSWVKQESNRILQHKRAK